jgi:hypothetical protein
MTEELAVYEVQSAALPSYELATLADLEEASYRLVQDLGDAEWKLIEVLAAIRDSGMWKQSHERFDEYLRDWAIEASNRLPSGRGLPVSVRLLQAKLSLHRRLVGWAGMAPSEVLAQPWYVMDRLCRTLGRWDYKTGAPTLSETARQRLTEQYGEQPEAALIQRAVGDVSHIAIPGDAIQFIKDNFGPTIEDQTVYEIILEVHAGFPVIRCHVQEFDKDGLTAAAWYGPDRPWPEDAIAYLARLLGVQATERS